MRELHIRTSELVREASEGSVIVIERRGEPVAELRPLTPVPRMSLAKKTRIYLNEPESPRVRELVRTAEVLYSSAWAMAEFHAVLHRCTREGGILLNDARDLSRRFLEHLDAGLWNLVPVTEVLLRRTSSLIASAPANIFIRTADAVHLATAQETGAREVWTNDRHMLGAASYFGLAGQSV